MTVHEISLREAFDLLHDHQTIVTSMAACEPTGFYSEIHRHIRRFHGIKIFCANPTQAYDVFEDESLEPHVGLRPMFLTSVIRDHQRRSHVHYLPGHLSQWVANISRAGEIDLFWGTCSVPDHRGFVSLGLSACYEYEMLKLAKVSVLEINQHMPFVFGAPCIPVQQVDHFVRHDRALPVIAKRHHDSIDSAIATNIAELVPDDATVQLGIGSIPDALEASLATKKHLGVHTEMINDTMARLAMRGVIDGSKKSLWPQKMIGTFIYGSEELYRYVDGNPLIELHPAAIVNDPHRIGRNHRMMSINTAVEIDLTGQVCSESIGHYEISGVGGATDTHIGAQMSANGRGIIALRSQTRQGKSKLVCELTAGAKVSISRNDVDTVVTEYGVAELKGRTVDERVRRLVAIAHPSARSALLEEAQEHGYL